MAPRRYQANRLMELATDLGLDLSADPREEIFRYAVERLRSFLRDFPCSTLTELLDTSAALLDTLFVEIRTDDELVRVQAEYKERKERAFVRLHEDLKPDVYAVTYRRLAAQRGERQFVSVIDCRKEKAARVYFSKWHELAHLLALADRMCFKFCRTHSTGDGKDAEERLMDRIASEVGFLPELIRPLAEGTASFRKIDDLRASLCTEASLQASAIGFARAWPSPCILIEAGLGYKKAEEGRLNQLGFYFAKAPVAEVRVLSVNVNEPARQSGLFIPPNMRIPQRSIIYRTFKGELVERGAVEDLSWWEASSGERLEERPVFIETRKAGECVFALLTLTS